MALGVQPHLLVAAAIRLPRAGEAPGRPRPCNTASVLRKRQYTGKISEKTGFNVSRDILRVTFCLAQFSKEYHANFVKKSLGHP